LTFVKVEEGGCHREPTKKEDELQRKEAAGRSLYKIDAGALDKRSVGNKKGGREKSP